MRGSRSDLEWAVLACCDTLRGRGVGSAECFERATRGALDTLILLEQAGHPVDRLLYEAAAAEQAGASIHAVARTMRDNA
jgi:hypothetical protein